MVSESYIYYSDLCCRLGSLIVSYTVLIPDDNVSKQQFSMASQKLAQVSTITVFNETLSVTWMTIGDSSGMYCRAFCWCVVDGVMWIQDLYYKIMLSHFSADNKYKSGVSHLVKVPHSRTVWNVTAVSCFLISEWNTSKQLMVWTYCNVWFQLVI